MLAQTPSFTKAMTPFMYQRQSQSTVYWVRKTRKIAAVGFSLLLLLLCVWPQAYGLAIKTSSIDQREYAYLELDNKLKVLLISDPKTEKAAASLNVKVGSYDDPWERQGLAHFLEHMLFLGTKKYPEADEYQSFIDDNGGSHNAYTSRHDTNYFFDVDVDRLEPALDRFAQFFVAPLFDELYVDRERNAVHSEFQATIQEDFRRNLDVYRHVVNPKHPAAKFNVGSLDTLANRPKEKVRDDLLDFYRQHYSADRMALVVLGNASIKALKAWVLPRFSAIPLRETKALPPTKEPLFAHKQLPQEVIIRPVKDLRQMSLSFQLPATKQYYRQKPLQLIAHLLGHEGKGSLLAVLKAEGLAENLSAGGGDNGDNSSTFHITIQLTKQGLQQRDKVRAMVFAMLKRIRQQGLEPWRFEEQRLLAATAFNFREQGPALQTVKGLAPRLFDYPPEELISSAYLFEEFDPERVRALLDYLVPEQVYVSTTVPEAETDQVSPYYQSPYRVQSIPSALPKLKQDLLKRLQLPSANPFVPESTGLFPAEKAIASVKQLSKGTINLWAKQDLSFAVPRAQVQLRLSLPSVSGKLAGVALNALYVALLNDQLNEFSYDALLAGASLSIEAHNRGIDIAVSGYHDKLYRLMERLLVAINAMEFDELRYEQIKSDLLRAWRNRSKQTPYRQLYSQLAVNLYQSYWANDDKISALEAITLEDVRAFAKTWRQGTKIKGLLYGNISAAWIKPWQPLIQQLQQPGDQVLAAAKVQKLPQNSRSFEVFTVDHSDRAAMLYVQGLGDSLVDQANMTVLRQIMRSPFYSALRTEQQLGYIVFMGSLRLKQVPGSVFVVQSPSASVDQVMVAIDTFLRDFEAQFPKDISVYQQAVNTQLLDPPQTLAASAREYWDNLLQDKESFDYRQQLAKAVTGLTAEQVLRYFKAVMLVSSPSLWQLSQQPDKAMASVPFKGGGKFYQYP